MSKVFPYFGSKDKIGQVVYDMACNTLGGPPDAIYDPFMGSLGTWLGVDFRVKPGAKVFNFNDIDCQIVNVWRSILYKKDEMRHLIEALRGGRFVRPISGLLPK